MRSSRRLVILTFLVLFAFNYSFGQKFAFIDSEYILSNIPEYKEAKKQLDEMSKQWQLQAEKMFKEIEKMRKDFEAEEILLTEGMKNDRLEKIIEREQAAKDFQKEKFGVDGELFKKRKELMKPIQEKLYKAVQETANVGKYSIIFDKASGPTMIYSNPKYDKSDDVLKRMGYKPGTSQR